VTGARTWGFGQVEMKTGLTVSGIGHVAVLAWCLVAFAAKPYESIVTESVPVDIISESQFSQLTAGSKNAPQTETPKPLVEKIGEKKPTEDPNSKIVDKKEITSSTDKEPPPPPPEPKQAKQADKKQAEPKRDLIAEALKKDEAKKPEPKKAEAKPPPLPKRPAAACRHRRRTEFFGVAWRSNQSGCTALGERAW
jgi:colicin import membrane protein